MDETGSRSGRRPAARKIAGDGRGGGRLRDAIDGLTAFVGVLTPDGTLVEANSAALRAAGLRHEDVIGLPFDQTYWWSFSPESQSVLRAAIERASRGESSRFDATNRVAEGRLITVDFTLAPVCDPAGRVSHLIASGVDITERKRAEEALRESETKEHLRAEELQSILDAVPAGVWIAEDPLCLHITGNRASYEILRLPEGANQSPTAPTAERPSNFRVLRPDGREYAPEELPQQRAAATGLPQRDVRLDILFDDGLRRNIYGNAVPLFDTAGEPRGAVSAFVDVTALVEAEAALAESERRFRATFEQAAVGVAHVGRDGRWLMVNSKLCEIVGYTREELLGLPFQEITHPEDLDADVEQARRLLAGEINTYSMEKRYVRRDGSHVWINLTGSLVRDERAGDPLYFIAVVEDISERKRAEKRVRQQAAMLDVAQDAIVIRNMEDRILYWNKGAERLYGWTAREAAGRDVAELLYREPTPQFRKAQAVLAERGEWRGELHQVTKEGRDIIVEGRWTQVRDSAGRPYAKLVVNTDITERKRLEAELLRATQLSLVGELAASLAHEIKNPLAGLKGAVDILIQRHAGGGLVAEVLEDMRHAVERVDGTVRDLLQRARPHALRLEPAPVAEAAHRAVQLARHRAEAHRVSITFEPPAAPIIATIDTAQIEGAVFNLIINGIEAIEGGGRVAVRVRLAGGALGSGGAPAEAVVEVEDDGRGINEEDLAQIFHPFHTTTSGGTGLGLPAVRRVALAHGGRVEVRSAPGRGSTFSLHLPVTDQP